MASAPTQQLWIESKFCRIESNLLSAESPSSTTEAHWVWRGAMRSVKRIVSLTYCHDVRPSVRLSATGMHCNHTVHVNPRWFMATKAAPGPRSPAAARDPQGPRSTMSEVQERGGLMSKCVSLFCMNENGVFWTSDALWSLEHCFKIRICIKPTLSP